MLSIQKLVVDQSRYYLESEHGRVDAIDSVAGGAEDYYGEGGEAPGAWLGRGARRLGLDGKVAGDELRALFAGRHPRTGEVLRDPASRVKVAAYDLTFSAPKSVSVLFGVSDPATRAAVRGAHEAAVREAVGYLERSAAAVRRGAGGAVVEEVDGFIAAGYRHRASREGDPQLHTHVLVANLGQGSDGRWSALDGRRLYAHATAASRVYQAVLRGELTRALGLEWSPVSRGIGDIKGVPGDVLRAFSRRRGQIEAAMTERGTSGARAAEAAALATRRRKDRSVGADALFADWADRAGALGWCTAHARALVRETRTRDLNEEGVGRLVGELVGPTGLTQRRSTFTRRDVIAAVCERLPAGTSLTAATIEAVADRAVGSDDVVPLIEPTDGERFVRRDGRVLRVGLEDRRYTTAELLTHERRLLEVAQHGREAGAGVAGEEVLQSALRSRPGLNDEQARMVRTLTRSGARIDVVAGPAGTGKTFALAAAHEAWTEAGHHVFGVAVARRAAKELETGAGIPSTSIAALRDRLQRGRQLPRGAVLVVDEAGMVATRDLVALLDGVERADGKLVLVGDHRQLPELEAGGAFRGLVRRGLAVELRENMRQVDAWERRAVDHLRSGRAGEALALYARHGRLHLSDTEAEVRDRVVGDWWQAGGDAVMLARQRVTVAELNSAARQRMRDAGRLGDEELSLPAGRFAVGDRVLIRRNDPERGVSNGDRATVVALDQRRLRLTVESRGRVVELGASFLLRRTREGEPSLTHGYAMTCHVAQGMTVDRSFVLADGGLCREWGYTALTRGREANHLYVSDDRASERDDYAPAERAEFRRSALEGLEVALARSEAEPLALDVGRPIERARTRAAGREIGR